MGERERERERERVEVRRVGRDAWGRNNQQTVFCSFVAGSTCLLTPRISYRSSEGDAVADKEERMTRATRRASAHWARVVTDTMDAQRKLAKRKKRRRKGCLRQSNGTRS